MPWRACRGVARGLAGAIPGNRPSPVALPGFVRLHRERMRARTCNAADLARVVEEAAAADYLTLLGAGAE